MNLCILTPGCGTGINLTDLQNGLLHIQLTPDHPVSESLQGTAFAGADSMDVDTTHGTFKLNFPDAERSITGKFVQVGSSWEMTEFYFQTSAGAGEMKLDPNTRQIVSIATGDGATWHPAKVENGSARLSSDDRLDSYLASNSELVSMTNRDGKTDAQFAFLPFFFITIMIIWLLCAEPVLIVCPGIIPIFSVIIAILGSVPPPTAAPEPVPPANNAPDARDDAFTMIAGSVLTSEVLTDHGSGPDSDPDGNSLTTTVVTTSVNGVLALQPSGDFTYTPNPGYRGTDTFVYQLSDGNGGTDNATVTITVQNRPPVARNDAYTVFADVAAIGNLFLNNGSGVDSDPDGDPITVIAVNGSAANVGSPITLPGNTTVTVSANGDFEYGTPFPIVSVFTYTISDGNGGTSTATATITAINVP